MEWPILRFYLFEALRAFNVQEIYKLDRENNVIDLCVILQGHTELRKLTLITMLDSAIKENAPMWYRRYVFTYEVWQKKEWDRQYATKVLFRNRARKISPVQQVPEELGDRQPGHDKPDKA